MAISWYDRMGMPSDEVKIMRRLAGCRSATAHFLRHSIGGDRYVASRILRRLKRHGMVGCDGRTWSISDLGRRQLENLASPEFLAAHPECSTVEARQ